MPNHDTTLLPIPVVQTRTRSSQRNRTRRSLSSYWELIKRRIWTVKSQSTTSTSRETNEFEKVDEDKFQSTLSRRELADEPEVDEVVVDRIWSDDPKSSVSQYHSDHSEESGVDERARASLALSVEQFDIHAESVKGVPSPFAAVYSLAWPILKRFFSLHFHDETIEAKYREENWTLNKSLALWASGFVIANWAIGCAFIQPPITLMDKIFYFGVAPFLTIMTVFMIVRDWPRDHSNIYQATVCVSTWSWSFYQVLFLYFCGFYDPKAALFTCGTKDFLSTFYYTSALQSFSLFGLKMNRFPGMIGALFFLILSCVLIVPIRLTWSHNVINFTLFQSALLYMHYMREKRERRLYTLRMQLQVQCKATQNAQLNERKAAESKRRLTSYVFHVLAVQNLAASGIIAEDQAIEFNALEGSLSMMSKVLNDVLDFNRMDSGKLESLSRPYCFHQVMRSLFIPVRLVTNARNLVFEYNLDRNIDQVARRAAYEAMGENSADIVTHMEKTPEVEGIVVGDEIRLRQIVTNLASNACKFTPEGGKLTISTRLILPSTHPPSESIRKEDTLSQACITEPHSLSMHNLSLHNLSQAPSQPLDSIVVRIEVTDTGCGIKAEDMIHSKLFSAFNQTEQGRQQGGNGTGLGLALVRQIVKLSGGRLGVQSRIGRGSTFWVELPLGVGPKTTMSLGPKLLTEGPLLHHLDDIAARQMRMDNDTSTDVCGDALHGSHSSSALHDLMEQGGRVELALSRYNSSSSVPNHLSCEFAAEMKDPASSPSPPTEIQLTTTTERPSAPEGIPSNKVVVQSPQRPNHLRLPSRGSFSLSAATSTPPLSTPSSDTHGFMYHGNNVPRRVELRILVVDDDPLTRTLMTRMLTRMGHKVDTVENGELALEMITGESRATRTEPILENGEASRHPAIEGKYAVVFLDNQMPIMTGLEAVAKLRGMGRRDFVVGITGNALLTDQQEYLEAGADHVLTKPVLERHLKGMLDLAEEKQQQQYSQPQNALQ